MTQTIGQYLKIAMKAQKVTQQELADRIGMARSTVGMYVSDNAVPSEETWLKIIEALSLDVMEAQMFFSNYLLGKRQEERTEVIENVRKIYGSIASAVLDRMGGLTSEGQKKVLERIEELLEVNRYNQEYQDYQANAAKEHEQ